jgi:precorrin-3B synthase
LSATSAALFAAGASTLGIGSDGTPLLTNPLSGLIDGEMFDAQGRAAEMRTLLATAPFTARLAAKVSAVIDGGGALHLDDVAADIRMRAIDRRYVHVALAGDAASGIVLGAVPLERAAECILRLFETLAAKAPRGRMRDAIQGQGLNAFRSAVADLVVDVPVPSARPAADPIGLHGLSSGASAVGVGLPFGHSDSEILARLVDAAGRAGASGLRTAPGRALFLVGIPVAAARQLVSEVGALGFIVDPGDPRRRVVACAGAPICASGEIAARAMAPALANAARVLPAGEVIHVSGCAKGCAHPAPAPLAVFGRDGRCDVFVDGVLSCIVTAEALPAAIERLVLARGGAR